MLSLSSDRWKELAASPGGSGELALDLLAQAVAGAETALAELTHQVCHQFTTGQVAYAAVPHLVELAATRRSSWPLAIIGMVVVGRDTRPGLAPAIPADLLDDYESSLGRARELTAEMLGRDSLEADESQSLLGTLAALTGHTNLGMHILLLAGEEPSCPSCGEPIDFIRPAPV